MVLMEVSGVYSSSKSAYPQVVLKQVDGSAYLPIVIGRFEAAAIAMAQAEHQPARPISYDLAQAILQAVGASIERVEVTDLRDGTYYAQVHLRSASGAASVLDSRPSDAIALALRVGAPIYAAQEVLKAAGFVRPEDVGDAGSQPAQRPAAARRAPARKVATPTPAAATEPRGGAAAAPASSLESLRSRLDQAVAREEYEEAARLRDQIRRLDSGDRQ